MAYYRLRSGAPPPGSSYKKRCFTPSKTSVNQQLTQLKRKVARFTPETKLIQIGQSMPNVADTAGAIIYISGVAQGTDFDDRLGSKVRAVMFELNVAITSTAIDIGGDPADMTSVYLVKDVLGTGALPSISGTQNSVMASFSPLAAFVNPLTRDRFKILRQWDVSAATITTGNTLSLMKWRVPVSGLTEYTDTTVNVSGSHKNAYYVIALTNMAADAFDVSVNGFFHFQDA